MFLQHGEEGFLFFFYHKLQVFIDMVCAWLIIFCTSPGRVFHSPPCLLLSKRELVLWWPARRGDHSFFQNYISCCCFRSKSNRICSILCYKEFYMYALSYKCKRGNTAESWSNQGNDWRVNMLSSIIKFEISIISFACHYVSNIADLKYFQRERRGASAFCILRVISTERLHCNAAFAATLSCSKSAQIKMLCV